MLISHKRLPPDGQQHLQGLCQTIGAPLRFSVWLTFLTLFFKKKNALFFIECHNGRKIGLQFLDLNLQKLGFFLIKAAHNLKFLHALIIQFQNTTLITQAPHGKVTSLQDSHRFHHKRAARCPPLFFSAWVVTRFSNPCTLLTFQGAIRVPFLFPSQQVIKGPLGYKLPVAGLGQPARVQIVESQQVKSPGRINSLDFLGTLLLGKTAGV